MSFPGRSAKDTGILFAGIPVADYAAARPWYERLFGGPPDVIVHAQESMWQLADAGWAYLLADRERAGTALVTVLVDDLDRLLGRLAEDGLVSAAVQTLSEGQRKATIHDPEGNAISFAELPRERASQTPETAPRIVLRPLAHGDEDELLRIHRTPEVKRWWDEPAESFPWDEPESTRFTIERDGAVAGLIQYWEESEPRYRHAGVDLFVDPALHGRGIGAEAVRRVVRILVRERGHHRITIDPSTANAAAIRAYEKVGFRSVGVMRQAERDTGGGGWHDALLMELLADDVTGADTDAGSFQRGVKGVDRDERDGRPQAGSA